MNIAVKALHTLPLSADSKRVSEYLSQRDLPEPTRITLHTERVPDQTNPGSSLLMTTISLHGLDSGDPDIRAIILDDCGESLIYFASHDDIDLKGFTAE